MESVHWCIPRDSETYTWKDKNIKQLKNKRREYWYYKGRKTNQGGTVYSYRVRLEDGVVTEFGDGKYRS